MPKNLYIKTYGCQMNEYDSQRIRDLLTESGDMVVIEHPENADILLIVTCSVREKAEEKVFSDLGRYREIKERNKKLIIGVGGCVASQEKENILKRAPYVDLVFGPQTLHRLPAMLAEVTLKQTQLIDVEFPEIEKFDHLPKPQVEGPAALISIMEGCNKHCTYCIVPYTRGKEFSRPVEDVLAEIKSLAENGVKEVTLLGQNVNDYHGKTKNAETINLADLIRLVAKIDGIDRIRFITSHPLAFSDALINAFRDEPKLVDHLHLPVQSGSDRILKRMGRQYTVQEFKDKIARLRTVRPNISIASDFIVGFPGETEEDFEQTMQLVRDIKFDHSFSFMYSPRPGTPATKFLDDVPLEVKKVRLTKLQTLLDEIEKEIRDAMIGSVQTILVTGYAKKNNQLTGRTENTRTVNFDGDLSLIGQFVDIEIISAIRSSLSGIYRKHSINK